MKGFIIGKVQRIFGERLVGEASKYTVVLRETRTVQTREGARSFGYDFTVDSFGKNAEVLKGLAVGDKLYAEIDVKPWARKAEDGTWKRGVDFTAVDVQPMDIAADTTGAADDSFLEVPDYGGLPFA